MHLHQGLQRSKGHPRGAILLLPLLDDNEIERKRSENTKYHVAGAQEVRREGERGEGVRQEGKGDSLHHMMSRKSTPIAHLPPPHHSHHQEMRE